MIFRHFLIEVDMAIAEVNAHMFGCAETGEVMLIDCGAYDPRFEEFLHARDIRLTKIFVTHDHGDHVAGLAECAARFGAETIAGTPAPGGHRVDRIVKHGDEIRVGKQVGRVVETPGHTPIALSLIFPGIAFTGDALFAGSVGGTGAQADYDRQIKAVREHILSLPDETEVHSGHGPATTVGIERRFNPFFV